MFFQKLRKNPGVTENYKSTSKMFLNSSIVPLVLQIQQASKVDEQRQVPLGEIETTGIRAI